jgi:hypothetical protein
MTFRVPEYVRRLLTGDHLEQAEADAVRLGVVLLAQPSTTWLPQVEDELSHLLADLAAMPANVPTLIVTVAEVRRLTEAGVNDPRLEQSAAPWLFCVGRFLGVYPWLASKTARLWYETIDRVALASDDRVANRSLAPNIAGVTSAYAEEDAKAEHLLLAAQVEAEGQDENEAAPFLQACRWTRTAIRRATWQ